MYMRAFYTPPEYTCEEDWLARELIDTSKAVVSPNIFYHLTGSKKIQQVTSSLDVMSQFSNEGETMAKYFTELWSLDHELDQELLDKVRQYPEQFVLKPQREGGDNNFFGKDILPFFENYPDQELKKFILMQRIQGTTNVNLVAKNREVRKIETISEIGVYGSLVAVDGDVVHNEFDGYLLRTKYKDANEGGVASGYSVIDSIFLED